MEKNHKVKNISGNINLCKVAETLPEHEKKTRICEVQQPYKLLVFYTNISGDILHFVICRPCSVHNTVRTRV